MITIYRPNEEDFTHNGLAVLDNYIITPVIEWNDNGLFSLSFLYPLFEKEAKYIVDDAYIKARDPETENIFFVSNIVISMGYLQVFCYQISYQLASNYVEDINLFKTTGDNAIKRLLQGTQYKHFFVGSSNITKVATSRVVRKNPIEILINNSLDNSFINRWGGHLVRHGKYIELNKNYGSNKGYTIRDSKDLLGYENDIDYSSVVTRLVPLGFDGIKLPEMYVDSPLINNYTRPKISEKVYSDIKIGTDKENGKLTEQEAYDELRRLANLEYSENKIDLPKATYKVSFVNLSETEEYKDVLSLKQILPGDTVKVIHEKDGFEIEAKMVSYKYDPLAQTYIETILGNFVQTFTSIQSQVENMQNKVDIAEDNAHNALVSANGKNSIYTNETLSSSPKVGDTWFKDNGDVVEIWNYQDVDGIPMWVRVDPDVTEIKEQVNQAQKDAEQAKEDADNAVSKATQVANDLKQTDIAVQGAVSQAASAFQLANQTDGRLVNLVTDVNILEGRVTQTASKVDGHSGQISVLQKDYASISSTVANVQKDLNGKINVTEFSSWTQTVMALQGTVSNKAEKSEVTLMAGQLTSLLTSMKENYLLNSDFRLGNSNWNAATIGYGSVKPVGQGDADKELPQTVQKFFTISRTSITADIWLQQYIDINVIKKFAGKIMNVSYYVKTNSAFAGLCQVYTRTQESGVYKYYGNSPSEVINKTLNWKRCTYQVDLTNVKPEELTQFNLTVAMSAKNWIAGNLYITAMQVTEGGTLLDWDYEHPANADYSQFTQLRDNINLRVQKGDVINQINIGNENILIAGQKVHITGLTTIDNAVITSAMVKEIIGDKITAGTINAAQVKIINLDANNITANATNFIQSNWNSISGQVKIDGVGLRTYNSSGETTSLVNGSGHKFYRDNKYLGNIGTSIKSESPQMRGLTFNLGYQANYMSWSYEQEIASGNYLPVLQWNNKNFTMDKNSGFVFYDNIHITGQYRLTMTNFGPYTKSGTVDSSRDLVLSHGSVGGVGGTFIRNQYPVGNSNGAGIFISANNFGVAIGANGSYKWLTA